ncbi:hypothetical protein MSAN_02173000 [Mycena sanguinolenta]|uniref:Uncharacterized protein n=1 Tax=Mycena sanguinolenta TaxID=230812 RepID=A0A8H6XDY0_9AGAR|nr:hypothetical protein MSAN_02173000 [Mycena sanguinolenta]
MLRRAHDEDHLRHLLDQRSTALRQAMHLEDYDSPSVYSAPYFSPRPNDIAETRSLHSYRDSPSPTAPVEPRNRLNELAHSMLDLDDEPVDDDRVLDTEADPDDQDDSRLSMLGPKMRFHGKAPWEMDAETLDEEDEEDDRSTRGRDGFRKGLASFRSSSRGTTASARPSGESNRSNQPKHKRSFDSTASSPYGRGGLALQPTPASRQAGLRLNLPLSGPATPPRAPASPRSIHSPHSKARSPTPPRSNHEYAPFHKPSLTRRATNESATSQSLYSEEMHPYANPDLVVSYADEQAITPAPARSAFNNLPDLVRSNSTATVTESLATSRSGTGSTLTPDTSASSVALSQSGPRTRPLPTNNISSPLITPGLPPGWMERSQSPTFQLISLEQARAQRSRPTAQNLSISSTSSTPFPETPPAMDDPSPPSTIASRTRARSISTGARAKTTLQNMVSGGPGRPPPERQNSEPTVPPGKTLKHKKEWIYEAIQWRPSGEGRKVFASARAVSVRWQTGPPSSKSTIHRVPPPQLSPSMFEPQMPQSRLRAASTADDFQTRTGPSDMSDRDWNQQELPQSAPANVTEFPALRLRPVSTLFSAQFADHLSPQRDSDVPSQLSLDADVDTLSSTSPSTMISPVTPGLSLGGGSARASDDREMGKQPTIALATTDDQSALVQALQEQIASTKKAWQRHIWELEGQRAGGVGTRERNSGTLHDHKVPSGVVNRPRARTGTSARFGSAV